MHVFFPSTKLYDSELLLGPPLLGLPVWMGLSLAKMFLKWSFASTSHGFSSLEPAVHARVTILVLKTPSLQIMQP